MMEYPEVSNASAYGVIKPEAMKHYSVAWKMELLLFHILDMVRHFN